MRGRGRGAVTCGSEGGGELRRHLAQDLAVVREVPVADEQVEGGEAALARDAAVRRRHPGAGKRVPVERGAGGVSQRGGTNVALGRVLDGRRRRREIDLLRKRQPTSAALRSDRAAGCGGGGGPGVGGGTHAPEASIWMRMVTKSSSRQRMP